MYIHICVSTYIHMSQRETRLEKRSGNTGLYFFVIAFCSWVVATPFWRAKDTPTCLSAQLAILRIWFIYSWLLNLYNSSNAKASFKSRIGINSFSNCKLFALENSGRGYHCHRLLLPLCLLVVIAAIGPGTMPTLIRHYEIGAKIR